MSLTVYLISALLLLAAAFVVFRVIVLRDYLRRGRLTPFSTLLQLVIWGLYFTFPLLFNPDWPAFLPRHPQFSPALSVVGLISIAVGFAAVVAAIAGLGVHRSLGWQVNMLKQSGAYRVTRNPQIVGATPLVIGYAVLRPSWWALGWVFLYAAIAHLMVLTEEEHLRQVHGEEYARYCEEVPRYLCSRIACREESQDTSCY
jgi:protein-S-isoprenylcysteine O-methyltransferase Ste14